METTFGNGSSPSLASTTYRNSLSTSLSARVVRTFLREAPSTNSNCIRFWFYCFRGSPSAGHLIWSAVCYGNSIPSTAYPNGLDAEHYVHNITHTYTPHFFCFLDLGLGTGNLGHQAVMAGEADLEHGHSHLRNLSSRVVSARSVSGLD